MHSGDAISIEISSIKPTVAEQATDCWANCRRTWTWKHVVALVTCKSFFIGFVVVLTLLLLGAAVYPQRYRAEFEAFKQATGRTYSSAGEEAERFAVFVKNIDVTLPQLLLVWAKGSFGITAFMDWTQREFDSILGTSFNNGRYLEMGEGFNTTTGDYTLADKLWPLTQDMSWCDERNPRSRSMCTPQKQQFTCGNCFVQSAVAVAETAFSIQNNARKAMRLSTRIPTGCAKSSFGDGVNGCRGGWPEEVLLWIVRNGGLGYAELYMDDVWDYENSNHRHLDAYECRDEDRIDQTFYSWSVFIATDIPTIMRFLVLFGAGVVYVDSRNWQFLAGRGIVDNTTMCSPYIWHSNHAVVLVGWGYDVERKLDYWLLRNSWGENWGENGMIRVERSSKNVCGVTNRAIFFAPERYAPTRFNVREFKDGDERGPIVMSNVTDDHPL